jgi:hypothetical protein
MMMMSKRRLGLMVSMEMKMKVAVKEVIAGAKRREEEEKTEKDTSISLLHGTIPNRALAWLWLLVQL